MVLNWFNQPQLESLRLNENNSNIDCYYNHSAIVMNIKNCLKIQNPDNIAEISSKYLIDGGEASLENNGAKLTALRKAISFLVVDIESSRDA